MRTFSNLCLIVGLVAAQQNSRDTIEYTQELDAVPRAKKDGDGGDNLLTGYGLRGKYAYWKRYDNDEFYIEFSLSIDAPQLKNKQSFQSYAQFVD